jgi:hypothetical protein
MKVEVITTEQMNANDVLNWFIQHQTTFIPMLMVCVGSCLSIVYLCCRKRKRI